jgi:hypothetical protein
MIGLNSWKRRTRNRFSTVYSGAYGEWSFKVKNLALTELL